jgi:hypothetical protein
MRSLGIVLDEVLVEDDLHLVNGLELGFVTLDAEALVAPFASEAGRTSLFMSWTVVRGSLCG